MRQPILSSSNWIQYVATLTNFGNATQSLFYKLIGDSIFINGFITIGSSLPTGELNVYLPTGYTYIYDQSWAGQVVANDGGASYVGSVQLYPNPNGFRFKGPTGSNVWTATVPFTWSAGDTIAINNIMFRLSH